jgi:SAM-dependent methyltransferase
MVSTWSAKLILYLKAAYGFVLTVFLDNFDKPDYYEANVLTLANRDELAREIGLLFKDYLARSHGEILDLAAGTGIISTELCRCGFTLTAADINEKALAYLERRNSKIQTVVCDMNKPFPLQDNVFDGATSVWANRYIKDIDVFLSEIHRVLKPGGVFIWPVFKIDVVLWKKNAGLSAPTAFSELQRELEEAGFSHIEFCRQQENADRGMRTIFMQPYYFIAYK